MTKSLKYEDVTGHLDKRHLPTCGRCYDTTDFGRFAPGHHYQHVVTNLHCGPVLNIVLAWIPTFRVKPWPWHKRWIKDPASPDLSDQEWYNHAQLAIFAIIPRPCHMTKEFCAWVDGLDDSILKETLRRSDQYNNAIFDKIPTVALLLSVAPSTTTEANKF